MDDDDVIDLTSEPKEVLAVVVVAKRKGKNDDDKKAEKKPRIETNEKFKESLGRVKRLLVEQDMNILGIDPGPVWCGFCLFSLKQKVVIKAKIVHFRESKKKCTLEELIDSVTNYYSTDPDRFFSRASVCYIENQFKNQFNMSLQFSLQAMIGISKSKFVQKVSINSVFKQFFPHDEEKVKGKTPEQAKAIKYRENKANSVTSGVCTLSDKELERASDYFDKVTSKYVYNHNIMDSIWIARYAAKVFHGVELNIGMMNRD